MVTKQEINDLLKNKDQVRGVALKTDYEYIKSKFGVEGVKKVESTLKKWGFPLEYSKIYETAYYSEGQRMLSLLAIIDTFKLDNKKIEEIGDLAPRFSLIIKSAIRLLLSIDSGLNLMSSTWRKYHKTGEFKKIYYDKKNKKAILGLYFDIHPLFCLYMKGYVKRIMQMIEPDKKVYIKESKCTFKGADYHEYKLSWD